MFQNVLVASQGALGGSQTVLLASQGLSSSALRSQQPQSLTVLQQGNQQILLPPGFHASALNLKALQGLKVIPITPTPASKGTFCKQNFNIRENCTILLIHVAKLETKLLKLRE